MSKNTSKLNENSKSKRNESKSSQHEIIHHDETSSHSDGPASTTPQRSKSPNPKNENNITSHHPSSSTNKKPLTCIRDPTRNPLLTRRPLAPMSRKVMKSPTRGNIYNNNNRQNNEEGSYNEKKDIIPAYAFTNSDTGLLEIKKFKPPESFVSQVIGKGKENDDVRHHQHTNVPALYPIAVNGGGLGIYNDLREFAIGGISTFSKNNHEASRIPVRSFIAFPWNMGEGSYSSEKSTKLNSENGINSRVSDASLRDILSLDDEISANQSEDNSFAKRLSMSTTDIESGLPIPQDTEDNNPNSDATTNTNWKLWETVFNFMVRATEQVSAPKQRIFNKPMSTPYVRERAGRDSCLYNDEDFDFVLILQPKEVYAYWANILDFRAENGYETSSKKIISETTSSDSNDSSRQLLAEQYATPSLESKKRSRLSDTSSEQEHITPLFSGVSKGKKMPMTEPIRRSHLFTSPSTTGKVSVDSSGRRIFLQRGSLFDRAMAATPPKPHFATDVKKARDSIESKSPFRSGSRRLVAKIRNSLGGKLSSSRKVPTYTSRTETPPSSSNKPHHRRWGSHAYNQYSKRSLFSPPRSIQSEWKYRSQQKQKIKESMKKSTPFSNGKVKRRKVSPNVNPHCIEIEDIPNQANPRGIRKGAVRSNGLEVFLGALKRGIVVRQHRPHANSVFVKLSSDDGGDTMNITYVSPDDALIAFREQNIRCTVDVEGHSTHNNDNEQDALGPHEPRHSSKSVNTQEFFKSDSYRSDASTKEIEKIHKFTLPDYIAAQKFRTLKGASGGLSKVLEHYMNKSTCSGTFKAQDLAYVHRTTFHDPFEREMKGTYTFRKSRSKYVEDQAFSLILPGGNAFLKNRVPLKTTTENWEKAQGTKHDFRYLDFEAATVGQFWFIFRGFLLLQRDAEHGRFAAQRASGFTSNLNRRGDETLKEKDLVERKVGFHQEPIEKTFLQKTIINLSNMFAKDENDTVEEDLKLPAPPPSDYFLGFLSTGTQIWGRLRQAGLETQRIYALDTKKVMIKVRCPPERLKDGAEVLRLKLKTNEGYYLPFEREIVHQFIPSNDDSFNSRRESFGRSLFHSSERQHIIDFIINSRIRDYGAELSTRTSLGKDIQARVPIHMHARLEALYEAWVKFYKKSNWLNGRDGKQMTVDIEKSDSESFVINQHLPPKPLPSIFTRLFIGSFYQPLDSIEQYFGERVAFYFAWLQFCAYHMIVLSVVGVIVFICQITSDNLDHPIRPFFASFVMVWSFYVLVEWRKRQNFLAHRWGTLNYKEEEVTRPQFHGTYVQDRITKEWMMYYPSWKRWLKYCMSIPITLSITVCALLGILLVYANRDVVLARYFSDIDTKENLFDNLNWSIHAIGRKDTITAVTLSRENVSDPKFWYIIAGFPIVLGLALPMLNFIMMQVSRVLNDFENYRTETQYRNALIAKVIASRFVAYFAALYYYAYMLAGTDKEQVESGMIRISTTLVIYLTVAHWWSIFFNIVFPLIRIRWRLYLEQGELRKQHRELQWMELDADQNNDTSEEVTKKLTNKRILLMQAESKIWQEMMLPDYDPFFDYVHTVMLFTYVVCFSAVFPLTPLLVMINQLMNMRLDAYKICRSRRRPLAHKTGGIGVWEHVLHMVTVIGVMTNCSLMALTSSQFERLLNAVGTIGLFGVIIGWEHFMLLIKYLMQLHCSAYPSSVLDALKEEKHKALRERNSNLRAKKERRSFHYPRPISSSSIDSDSYSSDNDDEKVTFNTNNNISHHSQRNIIPSLETIASTDEFDISPLVDKISSIDPSPPQKSNNVMNRDDKEWIPVRHSLRPTSFNSELRQRKKPSTSAIKPSHLVDNKANQKSTKEKSKKLRLSPFRDRTHDKNNRSYDKYQNKRDDDAFSEWSQNGFKQYTIAGTFGSPSILSSNKKNDTEYSPLFRDSDGNDSDFSITDENMNAQYDEDVGKAEMRINDRLGNVCTKRRLQF